MDNPALEPLVERLVAEMEMCLRKEPPFEDCDCREVAQKVIDEAQAEALRSVLLFIEWDEHAHRARWSDETFNIASGGALYALGTLRYKVLAKMHPEKTQEELFVLAGWKEER